MDKILMQVARECGFEHGESYTATEAQVLRFAREVERGMLVQLRARAGAMTPDLTRHSQYKIGFSVGCNAVVRDINQRIAVLDTQKDAE